MRRPMFGTAQKPARARVIVRFGSVMTLEQIDEILAEQSPLYQRIALLEQALTEARDFARHDAVL